MGGALTVLYGISFLKYKYLTSLFKVSTLREDCNAVVVKITLGSSSSLPPRRGVTPVAKM